MNRRIRRNWVCWKHQKHPERAPRFQQVPGLQVGLFNTFSVHQNAVGAAQVLEDVGAALHMEHGVAATLGPVAEPYTIGFPKPYEFFVTLLTGKYTLVETYYRTMMLNSWMTTLIGDPLYNPFGAHPLLKEDLLRLSPKGVPPLWKTNE